MFEINTKIFKTEYREILEKHLCTECGGRMAEVDRINENGFLYVWHECVRSGCNGQWLEKSKINITDFNQKQQLGV